MLDDLGPTRERLAAQGYQINDPWDIVAAFESKVAAYAGSRYAVSVDSCTNALFLCLKYLQAGGRVTIPRRTYVSVAGAIVHAGCELAFDDRDWTGVYQLQPFPIYDGATRFTAGMYVPGSLHCLSFHIRKILAIGKGGMILTDDADAVAWLKVARYEGRHIDRKYADDEITFLGWNMYMWPELAARGIELFEKLPQQNPDRGDAAHYDDLTRHPVFAGLR